MLDEALGTWIFEGYVGVLNIIWSAAYDGRAQIISSSKFVGRWHSLIEEDHIEGMFVTAKSCE